MKFWIGFGVWSFGFGGEGKRTLGAPVEDQADLIGHGQRHEIAEADEDEDGGEKGERRTLGVEASSVGLKESQTVGQFFCTGSLSSGEGSSPCPCSRRG